VARLISEIWQKIIYKNISVPKVDWVLFSAVSLIAFSGLATMNSFVGDSYFFNRQIIWLTLSFVIFFVFSFIDWRFLRRTGVIVALFLISSFLLFFLFVAGSVFKGAQSWFNLGGFSFQPSDPVKIVLIIILANYFSRSHV